MSKSCLALFGFGLVLVLAQCVWAGDLRHVAQPPSANDLAGSWRPTDRIKDPLVLDRSEVITLTDLELRAATIRLRQDGTCEVKAVPNGFGRYIRLGDEHRNVECRWAVSTDSIYINHRETAVPVVELHVAATPLSAGGITDFLFRLYIGRKNGRFVLWNYAGDPDQEIVLEYTRLP